MIDELVKQGLDETVSGTIINLINAGVIQHITINY